MNAEPDTWQIGPDGRVLRVSEVWLEIVGRHNVDAPGYRWIDYVHEEDRGSVLELIAQYFAARQHFVIPLRARDHQTGRFVRLLTGGKPLADGGYLGWTRVARSDRRLIERIAQAVCLAFVVVA
jgi:PAS domain-containing protein